FKASGWFLVRAVAENPRTFRFAATAPFSVEVGDAKRRVSKSPAKFFLEWVRERAERVKLDDARQREEVLKYHTVAEEFWKGLPARPSGGCGSPFAPAGPPPPSPARPPQHCPSTNQVGAFP